MRVLIVSTYDITGGAAKSAYRLHKALLNEGIDSIMLVQDKKSDDIAVIGPETRIEKSIALIRPAIDRAPIKIFGYKPKSDFSLSWLGFNGVVYKIKEIDPDIVHLHWITDGFIKVEDIAEIKQPLVWSLQDMWAFTGGCHYDEGCGLFKYTCGKCPILGSKIEFDLSRINWMRKKKIFHKKNMVIVGPSKWIHKCAKESSLLKNHYHVNIPTPIDTSLYRPLDKKFSRETWNLPQNKKIVLFGAVSATSDVRKGFKELVEALKFVRTDDIELVVFGSSQPANVLDFGFRVRYVGHLYDDISLITLYNASDVVVVPSLQENLSNVIMESLSCGIPVVAFNVGGNPDMIEHQKNGYLAKPFDPADLAYGVDWVLNHKNYTELCKNAREKILREFDSKVVAKKYIELYEEILRVDKNHI